MFQRLISFISTHNLCLLYYLIRQKNLLKIAQILLTHLRNRKRYPITRLEDCLSSFTKTPAPFTLSDSTPIDIVLPVYNGFEFLDRLFSSIFRNTSVPFRMIMIDDCSSDNRVFPFLEKISSENPDNTLLLRNEENIGFVKSVNRGSTYSNNHFVIVNTDIEVPPKWLERLMAPILENENIASTTPFSNAADIFSFPGFPKDNPIFEGLDVTTLDSFFQHIDSVKMTIEIPSGVGFCMGINKNAVREIGMFDSETFHQGYCEENDWCMRAKKKGYKNVLVPNLFVFHKQSGSFLDKSKKKLMERNYWLLLNRHKNYLPAVYDFTLKDSLKPFRDFLVLIITANTGISLPDLVIGNSKDTPQNRYQDKKILRLLYDNKRKALMLQYQYKKYNLEMSISQLASFERLLDWIQIGTFFLLNKDVFPNKKEMETFIYRLNKRIRQALLI
jgi:GT2 family glycosyltransferase